MKKYAVRVFVPTVYEIKARNVDEAARKAVERYKKENKTWIESEVEVDVDGDRLITPKVYEGKVDEDDEYLS